MKIRHFFTNHLPGTLVAILVFLSMLEAFLVSSSMGTLLKYFQIAGILIMTYRLVTRRRKFTFEVPTFFLLLFMSFLVIALLWSESYSRGIAVLRSCALQVVFIFIASRFKYDQWELNLIQKALIAGTITLSVILVTSGSQYADYSDRLSINLNGENSIDPNNLGGLLAIGVGVLLPMHFDTRIKSLIKWGCIVLMGVALLMTGSRGALVSLVVAVAIVVLTQKRFKAKVKFLIIVALAFAAILYLNNISGIGFLNNILSRFDDISGSYRSNIWRSVLPAVAQKPFFGYGLGSSVNVVYRSYGITIGSHNTYLTLLLDGGFFVLFPFIALIVFFFKKYRKNPVYTGILACEAASLVCSFFIDTYNKKIFWIPLLLCFIAMKTIIDTSDGYTDKKTRKTGRKL